MKSGTEAYIGIGSNLSNPQKQVDQAITALKLLPETSLVAQSSWYRSRAVGPGDQPNYINGVARLVTGLSALQLLDAIQSIETAQGRVRAERWGARTLDLDILLFGDLACETERLCLPHPRLCERNFVLCPLAELNPELVLPGEKPLQELLKKVTWEGLEVIADAN